MGKAEDAARKSMDARLDELADLIFSLSQENVAKISDTGELLQSGYVEKEKNRKVIGYQAAHAVYVEFGTSPHMPPVEVIEAWAKRRGLASGSKELRSIAWAIAKKIEKYGTDPQPFLRPAVDAAIMKMKKS